MTVVRNTLLALALAPAFAAQAGTVSSTFDANADGWVTFQNNGIPVEYIPAGGNPGGYIAANDFGDGWAYVQAPAKFLAPAPYGGVFSFDQRILNDSPGVVPTIYKVRIGLVGNGLTLISEATLGTVDWTHYDFKLDTTGTLRKFSNLSQNYDINAPAPTESEITAALANLTGLYIATDNSNGTTNQGQIDRTMIDNVTFGDPIPEPTTLSVLALSALTLLTRRRRV